MYALVALNTRKERFSSTFTCAHNLCFACFTNSALHLKYFWQTLLFMKIWKVRSIEKSNFRICKLKENMFHGHLVDHNNGIDVFSSSALYFMIILYHIKVEIVTLKTHTLISIAYHFNSVI